jgi:cytochrome b pre-mRNA-processing protein 3
MNIKYINIYNKLTDLTRNKDLYRNFKKQDSFSDRLIFFLLHFAFFLKVFKKDNDKEILQEIYDYVFRQLELSIREVGYGDQSINKKMKDYLNLFYGIINKINDWDDLSIESKRAILLIYIDKNADEIFLTLFFLKTFKKKAKCNKNSVKRSEKLSSRCKELYKSLFLVKLIKLL